MLHRPARNLCIDNCWLYMMMQEEEEHFDEYGSDEIGYGCMNSECTDSDCEGGGYGY